jgi:RNA polymerase sigma-70 factor, ECF subfamily
MLSGGNLVSDRPDFSAANTSDQKTEQFVKLLGAHERTLFEYVLALTGNWQDTEEVMQRARINIWQHFGQYDAEKPFAPWARAIAYYQVLTFRKEKKRQQVFFSQHVLQAVSDRFEVLSDVSDTRREALLGCLEKLEPRKRDLLIEYYSSVQQTSDAIAKKLSLTPTAVRQMLVRIRKALLDCVKRTMRAELHS